MNKLLIFCLFTLVAPFAFSAEYEETRQLTLNADDLISLSVEAGPGGLSVVGVPESDEIVAIATIQVPRSNKDKAYKKMDERMVLELEKFGQKGTLKGYFEYSFWSFGPGPTIHLEVRVPEGLDLAVDDGTGDITIEGVRGDLYVDDGTGHVTLLNVGGDVEISDGTGSINVEGVGGDISIDDGTGEIDVRNVAGSVIVDDGAGDISIADVDKDLTIVNGGVGRLNHTNVKGRIRGDI